MIKCKKGRVEGAGKDNELIEDLAFIISTLITDGEISEEMIDIVVELGKAHAKGEDHEYMVNKVKEVQEKLKENANTIGINLTELKKQIEELKEKEEDED